MRERERERKRERERERESEREKERKKERHECCRREWFIMETVSHFSQTWLQQTPL